MSAENVAQGAPYSPVFLVPVPAPGAAPPRSPIQKNNSRASRSPSKSALRAPRYKTCNIKMQQQLEAKKNVLTMSMDLDIDGDDKRVESIQKIQEMQLGKTQDGKVPTKSQAMMSKIDAVIENHHKKTESSGSNSPARGRARRRRSKDRTNAGVKDLPLTSSSNCNEALSKSLSTMSKIDAAIENHTNQKESSGVKSKTRGRTKRHRSKDRSSAGAEDLSLNSSSNCSVLTEEGRFEVQELYRVEKNEGIQNCHKEGSGSPRPRGRSMTPQRGNTNSQDPAAVRGDERAFLSSSLSKLGDFPDATQPSRCGSHGPFSSSLNFADQKTQAPFNLEEFTTCVVIASEDGGNQDQQSLPLQQKGQKAGGATNPPASSPNSVDKSQDQHLVGRQSNRLPVGKPGQLPGERNCPHPPLQQQPETLGAFGNGFDESQTGFAPGKYPLQSQEQHEDANGAVAAPDDNDRTSKLLDDVSTLTHASPYNKISGAEQSVYECDDKGRCIHHPHVQLRKKKLLGRGWKVIMSACPDCCVEELRRIQFMEEENMLNDAREKRQKEEKKMKKNKRKEENENAKAKKKEEKAKEKTKKKKSSRRKGRVKKDRDGKHESDGKRFGPDKVHRNSSRVNNKQLQSSSRSTREHSNPDTPKIQQIAPGSPPTPPPRRCTSSKSQDTNAVQSTKRSSSHGLEQSLDTLDKQKTAGRRRSDETSSLTLTESSVSNEMLCEVIDSHGDQKLSQSKIGKRDVKTLRQPSDPPPPPRTSTRSRSDQCPHNSLITSHTAAIDTANALKQSSFESSEGDIDDSRGNFQRPQPSHNRSAATSKNHRPKGPVTPPPPPRPPRRSKSLEKLRQASVPSNIDTLVKYKGRRRSSSVKGGSRKPSLEDIDVGKQNYQRQRSFLSMNSTVTVAPPRSSHPQDSTGDISVLVPLNTIQHLYDEVALLSERLQRLSEEGTGNNRQTPPQRHRSFGGMDSNGSCSTTNKTFIPPPPPRRRTSIPQAQGGGPLDEMASLNRNFQIDSSNASHQHHSIPSRNSSSNNTINSIACSPVPPPKRSQSPGLQKSHILEQFRAMGGKMHAVDARFTDSKGRSGIYNGEVNDHFVPHGKGAMKYNSGVLKKGEWKNGKYQKSGMKKPMKSNF